MLLITLVLTTTYAAELSREDLQKIVADTTSNVNEFVRAGSFPNLFALLEDALWIDMKEKASISAPCLTWKDATCNFYQKLTQLTSNAETLDLLNPIWTWIQNQPENSELQSMYARGAEEFRSAWSSKYPDLPITYDSKTGVSTCCWNDQKNKRHRGFP
jgi:DNA-binding FadR family transcriptional regulator